MADTPRTLAQILALYADNTSGQISPQDARDFIVSIFGQGIISPSQITSNQNNYSPTDLDTARIVRINSDATRNLTGLALGTVGRHLALFNTGSFAITLKDESASSTAANRFALSGDYVLGADEGVDLWYDTTSSRWRISSAVGHGTLAGVTADQHHNQAHGASDHTNAVHSIPVWVSANEWAGASNNGQAILPDEDATKTVRIHLSTPPDWDGVSDITLKTIWRTPSGGSTGVVDLESSVTYTVETDEAALVSISGFANDNLTFAANGVTKVKTTTIAAANIAASRHYTVLFRRGTGDANTQELQLVGV